ncbi:hypothetical protein RJD39_12765 [Vibrio scophthalmi]|uniref:hypothetical protein n=1 Tax=Vibrio scophthalmi TaxID=45658 RepID=UPI0038736603
MSDAVETQEFNFDDLDFSPELINELEAIEPVIVEDDEPEQKAKSDYAGGDGEVTAEFLIDMVEAGFKSFVNEDYDLTDKKKALIVKNFSPVLNKYDGGVLGLLGDYKEEGQALFALIVLAFTMWACVKESNKSKKKTKKRTKKPSKKPVEDDNDEIEADNGD